MRYTFRQFEGDSMCRTRLTRPRTVGDVEIQVPIKTFLAFSFREYLAKLVARRMHACFLDQSQRRWRDA